MDKVIGSAVFLVFVVWFIAHVLPYIFIGILVILGIVAGVAILAGLASLISKN